MLQERCKKQTLTVDLDTSLPDTAFLHCRTPSQSSVSVGNRHLWRDTASVGLLLHDRIIVSERTQQILLVLSKEPS